MGCTDWKCALTLLNLCSCHFSKHGTLDCAFKSHDFILSFEVKLIDEGSYIFKWKWLGRTMILLMGLPFNPFISFLSGCAKAVYIPYLITPKYLFFYCFDVIICISIISRCQSLPNWLIMFRICIYSLNRSSSLVVIDNSSQSLRTNACIFGLKNILILLTNTCAPKNISVLFIFMYQIWAER